MPLPSARDGFTRTERTKIWTLGRIAEWQPTLFPRLRRPALYYRSVSAASKFVGYLGSRSLHIASASDFPDGGDTRAFRANTATRWQSEVRLQPAELRAGIVDPAVSNA
jgi:hypothetical protein